MYLRDYLFKKNMTIVDLANAIGVHRNTIYRAMLGRIEGKAKNSVSNLLGSAIEFYTKGQVKRHEITDPMRDK